VAQIWDEQNPTYCAIDFSLLTFHVPVQETDKIYHDISIPGRVFLIIGQLVVLICCLKFDFPLVDSWNTKPQTGQARFNHIDDLNVEIDFFKSGMKSNIESTSGFMYSKKEVFNLSSKQLKD